MQLEEENFLKEKNKGSIVENYKIISKLENSILNITLEDLKNNKKFYK